MKAIAKAIAALAGGLLLVFGYPCSGTAAEVARGAPVAQPAAIHRPLADPPPGHFAGSAALKPLTHLCRDLAGRPIRHTACPVTRDGRQLWAIFGTGKYATLPPLPPDIISLQPGETTDLASIPRLVSNIFPSDGPWTIDALYHDGCYGTHGSFTWHGHVSHTWKQPYTREQCDELLRQTMVASGIGTFQRITIFEAVRVGGAKGWGT